MFILVLICWLCQCMKVIAVVPCLYWYKLMCWLWGCLQVDSAKPCYITDHSSGAVWESRWPPWAVRPNEPSGFHGCKAILNHASALVSACPEYVNRHLRTLSNTTYLPTHITDIKWCVGYVGACNCMFDSAKPCYITDIKYIIMSVLACLIQQRVVMLLI